MAFPVVTLVEPARGCGFRKAGPGGVGIYLVGGYGGEACERLPYPVRRCPTCGHGIKRSRAWTWVDPREFFGGPPLCAYPESKGEARFRGRAAVESDNHSHSDCPLCSPAGVFRPKEEPSENGGPRYKADGLGLLWIGEKHYPTVAAFAAEAARMGVSRRLPAIPRGFRPGKTWVALVHPRAIEDLGDESQVIGESPGIFHVFRPSGFDLVIEDPENVPEKAERLAERLGEDAARIVRVIPESEYGETREIFEEAE